jgi:hypothetical protein
MKPTILFLSVLFFVLAGACSETNEDAPTSFEQDQAILEARLVEIQTIASSVECTNPDDWLITAYGAKPCGGPWGFIAYPTSINTGEFLALIDEYNQLNREFNEKWGLGSDCSVPAQPSGVTCENGEPVFLY